ncbi:MAG: hypothetical protein AB7F35_30290 [Acetobacteraceae bacterium]
MNPAATARLAAGTQRKGASHISDISNLDLELDRAENDKIFDIFLALIKVVNGTDPHATFRAGFAHMIAM